MRTVTLRRAVGLSLLLCACGSATGLVDDPPQTVAPTVDSGVRDNGGTGGTGGVGGTGGDGGTSGVAPACRDTYQRPVDVLFVIDNSGSMREEQQALRLQMPRMIRTLTSGEGSDGVRFVPVSDLHVGVVSTDMGLPGVPGRAGLGCGDETRRFGDDGVLRNAPNPGMAAGLTCAATYPSFLSFVRADDRSANDVLVGQLSDDFACIASLGTVGCGFEQQLESALRALWPSDNLLLDGRLGSFVDNRSFIDGSMFGNAGPRGPNTGFLRNDPASPSLLAIVLVTDEEDCSSHHLNHFIPPNFLADDDPLKPIGLNLRCFNEAVRVGSDEARDHGGANLYAIVRYAHAFKALRTGNEQLLVFAAIVGVPTDLTSREHLRTIDFTNADARNAYYDSVLADPRMREQVDPGTVRGNPNLIPSCLRDVFDPVSGMAVRQKAFPPRRIIKLARELGESAVIQSICRDDFTPAVDSLLSRIGDVIRNECPMK